MQDKSKVGASFAASASTYDEHALVQQDVARRLAGLISSKVKGKRVLEIGCGTGLFTEQLAQKIEIETLFLNDLAETLCKRASNRAVATEKHLLPGDGEYIELPDNLDLVVSSSSLQWFSDLTGFLSRLKQKIRPHGQIALAFYGVGTMHQLTSITGQGLEYLSCQEVEKILAKNFSSYELQTYENTLYFPNIFSILRHVKQTGVGAVSGTKKKSTKLRELEDEYRIRYGKQQGLPLTYNCYLLTAQK